MWCWQAANFLNTSYFYHFIRNGTINVCAVLSLLIVYSMEIRGFGCQNFSNLSYVVLALIFFWWILQSRIKPVLTCAHKWMQNQVTYHVEYLFKRCSSNLNLQTQRKLSYVVLEFIPEMLSYVVLAPNIFSFSIIKSVMIDLELYNFDTICNQTSSTT